MIVPLLLMLASAQTSDRPPLPEAQAVSGFQPSSRATARATVSIRILNGARFGPAMVDGAHGAQRRQSQLNDAAGIARTAELLEFQ